jgi:phosphotransferase system HPr (HPr) family protein
MITRQIVLGGELPFSPLRLKSLADAAGQYQVRVLIRQGAKTYNGKSLLGLMALAREREREVTLVVDGVDEHQAAEHLATLLAGQTPAPLS